ncbi:MAG: hypothetical protein JW788_07615 [Candidatus Omnitrophica bacterium]|nr:hypothetical protein [Candidatus Omnitrophota bacterium]
MPKHATIKHRSNYRMIITHIIIGCFLLNAVFSDVSWALRPNAAGPKDVKLEDSLSQNTIPQSTLFEELYSRRDKGSRFTLPKDPENEYILCVHEDTIYKGFGFMLIKDEPEKHMLVVRTVPKDEDEISYPVGFVSGIYIDSNGLVNFEWLTTLDYEGAYNELKPWIVPSNELNSFIPAMAQHTFHGPHNQYHSQIKLLYMYLRFVLNMEKDGEAERFFQNAPKNLREKGMGTAMQEFLSSFLPVGSKIKSVLANEESLKAMKKEEDFSNTLIGEWYNKMGYDMVEIIEVEDNSKPTIILEKTRMVPLKTQWKSPDWLGDYRAEEKTTGSQDLRDARRVREAIQGAA